MNATADTKAKAFLSHFRSDMSTLSKDHDGRPFRVLRPCTVEESEVFDEDTGEQLLFVIEFTDERGGTFHAWWDEIVAEDVT